MRAGTLPIELTLNFLLGTSEGTAGPRRKLSRKTFTANLRIFTLITNTLAKDKEISDRWRGFADVADARHLANRVEPRWSMRWCGGTRGLSEAVASLLRAESEVVRQETPAALGPQRAAAEGDERRSPGAMRGDGSHRLWRFLAGDGDLARRFFDSTWIDAPMRPGKAPGAFAHPTVPSAHPYVLLNYQGKTRDVMTLAHELGHGVHQVLAAPKVRDGADAADSGGDRECVWRDADLRAPACARPPSDVKPRKAMLARKVEDMLNTVVRQIAFYTFERKVHTERRNGELTSDRCSEIWMEVQRESLGPAIELRAGL